MMRTEVRRVNSIPILEVSGEIDAHTCPELRQRIIELLDQGDVRLVVNLEKVNFIDSTGLGTLVGALKRAAEKNGLLVLVSTDPQIEKVLDITGLIRIFEVFRTEELAVNRLLKSTQA